MERQVAGSRLFRLDTVPIIAAYAPSNRPIFKNTVTLSYGQVAFTRIKTRNAQRLEELTRKGKLKVIFNSKVLEIAPDTAVLDVNGSSQRIPNDYVWVFAGGEPPTAFLKKIGTGFGLQDLPSTGSKEAKEAKQENALVS